MKIKKVTINKYKGFQEEETIAINSKNIFIYGENGSGKSSFYYALKDFFQSSVEDIKLSELRNFHLNDNKDDCSIVVEFDGGDIYELTESNKTTEIASIIDANRLKSFFTYKHLMNVHNVKETEEINVFDLIINGVLKHFSSAVATNDYQLGELYQSTLEESKKTSGRGKDKDFPNKPIKAKGVSAKAKLFNDAFSKLFVKPEDDNTHSDYLGTDTNYYLQKIYPDLRIDFERHTIIVDEDGNISGGKLLLDIYEKNRLININKPHLSLNEAKLSAIAISIFLAAIKRQSPFSRDIKPLFLDDILIGLDNENRLKILDILLEKDVPPKEKVFSHFQIFISTYDRHWYEMAKLRLKDNWSFIEFYKSDNGPQIISSGKTILEKARVYFNSKEYSIVAHLLRKESERILKKLLPLNYQTSVNRDGDVSVGTQTLGSLISRLEILFNELEKTEEYSILKINRPQDVIDNLSLLNRILFNPFSHSDIETPIYKLDLKKAFETVENIEKLKLPDRKLLLEKDKELIISLPEINYEAKIKLDQDIYKISYDGESAVTSMQFHIKTWTRAGVEYAKPTDNPPQKANEELIDKTINARYNLQRAIKGLNQIFKDQHKQEIDIKTLEQAIYIDKISVYDIFYHDNLEN